MHGSRSDSTTRILRPSTAAPHGFLCLISIYGRAPSGFGALRCCRRTGLDSGKALATTTTVTHGRSSGTRATDVACRHGRCTTRRNDDGPDHHVYGSRLARSPRGPAYGRAPDSSRWVLRGPFLFDCLRPKPRKSRRDNRRTAAGRRSLAVSDPASRIGRYRGVAGADRVLVRLASATDGAHTTHRGRVRHRSADGHGALPSVGRQRRAVPIVVFRAGAGSRTVPSRSY